jgi:hypothetical protein
MFHQLAKIKLGLSVASSSSAVSLWHQCLGHPDHHVLSQILDNFDFSCNKSVAHSCSSCRLGKQSVFLLVTLHHIHIFPFNYYIQMFGLCLSLVTLATSLSR